MRHAARAISSNCGSVDVLEALGVDVQSAPDLPKRSLGQAGICVWNAFLPAVHPKSLPRIMSQMRFSSTINLVGPLLNPTMPVYKVMGVPSTDSIDIEVRTLRELGFKRAFVMHGFDRESGKGIDELSTLGPSQVAELKPDGNIERSVIEPEEVGLGRARFADLASTRDVEQSALALMRVLMGKDDGPRADVICLNAAPVLTVMGKARDLREGIAMARSAIRNGGAMRKLTDWVLAQNADAAAGRAILERMTAKAG